MILMHKNIPVAEIRMVCNRPVGFSKIYDETELPTGTNAKIKEQEYLLIKRWYESRAIPNLRPDLTNIQNKIGMSAAEAVIKSAGISLTDTYWFKEENSNLTWEDVNFWDNGFVPVLANYYLDNQCLFSPSPDFTTDGVLNKFWYTSGGFPYLAKMNLDNILTIANEVAVYKIAQVAGLNNITPYMYGEINDYRICSCPCFVNNPNTDFVNALQIRHSDFTRVGINLIQYFIDNGMENDIKKMITLDCLVNNTDRHEKNYGYLKSESGDLQFAPLFDNGNSLGANKKDHKISNFDIKTPRVSRQEALQMFGCAINNDLEKMKIVLKETYEQYNISEEKYELAKKELEAGSALIEEKTKQHNVAFCNTEITEESER